MRTPLSILCFIILFSLCSCTPNGDQEWAPKQAPIMTQWAQDVDPENPWNVYPRPYLKRDHWTNLNGLWDYAISSVGSEKPDSFPGKILVPYPIESALSGVMERVDQHDVIWYSRTFKASKNAKGNRLILHFEAVDWHTKVWINNKLIGEHKGGYTPFSFDITEAINPAKENEMVVSVWDPTTEGTQAVGKQNSSPQGIWYTPSSGIWQTVWLETVADTYIEDYQAIADIDSKVVHLESRVNHLQQGDQIRYHVTLQGDLIAEAIVDAERSVRLGINDMQLWHPDHPVLYNLDIELIRDEAIIDQVEGYFGMRKISIGKDADSFTRILLNNEFVFQNGPLDQGFWPDGLYTPPTEEAMIYDLEMLKSMGFNMLRKHVKVESRRFYYWTDKMGLLVWQDMPNANFGRRVDEIRPGKGHTLQFEEELQNLILSFDNHPSIVMWVPFNEGWGQYDTERIVDFAKTLDSTRLVNNASGWTDQGVGDVHDIHSYPEPRAPEAEEDRAIVLGEFGGLGLPLQGHTWQQDKNWGYENMENPQSLLKKYEKFYQEVHRLVKDKGLSAVVYTQTTDVEIETNGLMTYDREIDKMGAVKIKKAHLGYHPPVLAQTITDFIDSYKVDFSSTKPGALIYYTTDGSRPDRNSNLFTTSFEITESTQLKALAVWKDGEESRIAEFDIRQVVPESAKQLPVKPGIAYQLYRGAWEKIPDFSSEDEIMSGINQKIDLKPEGELTQDFGLVYKGYLKVPDTKVYQFYVSSDDGGRLIINGETLIDYDGIHGMGEQTASIALEKGLHQIEFEYFQHFGGRGLKLSWAATNVNKIEIPAKAYFH